MAVRCAERPRSRGISGAKCLRPKSTASPIGPAAAMTLGMPGREIGDKIVVAPSADAGLVRGDIKGAPARRYRAGEFLAVVRRRRGCAAYGIRRNAPRPRQDRRRDSIPYFAMDPAGKRVSGLHIADHTTIGQRWLNGNSCVLAGRACTAGRLKR